MDRWDRDGRARARRRALLRRRLGALAIIAGGAAAIGWGIAANASSRPPDAHRQHSATTVARRETASTPSTTSSTTTPPQRAARLPANVAVGLRTVTFVDYSRTARLRNGQLVARKLVTEVRYPAVGRRGADDLPNAPPLRASAPYPLVIFGHGYLRLPDTYKALLDAWARAGYVVVAPIFQLGSPYAPYGANEADLPNWPLDMSFVLSKMLDADRAAGSPFAHLIEPHHIAATGQSDGGDTALAISFDPAVRDSRIDATIILSGAEIPYYPLGPSFSFPTHGPPLLATQGNDDGINPPSATDTFFAAAPSPKYLLTLLGANHLGPYTNAQPYLGIVERVTIAFLNRYLKDEGPALRQMLSAGAVSGVATIQR